MAKGEGLVSIWSTPAALGGTGLGLGGLVWSQGSVLIVVSTV